MFKHAAEMCIRHIIDLLKMSVIFGVTYSYLFVYLEGEKIIKICSWTISLNKLMIFKNQ